MLTLLLKRQARAKILAEQQTVNQSKVEPGDDMPGDVQKASRPSLDEKPWDEVQQTLKVDLEYSRTLAGSQEKVPFKEELIKKYTPLVKKLLSTHDNLEGLDVIWWFYQWQIDCGLLALIHDEFKAAILKGLNTPSSWKSGGQTAYCDIVFKYSHEAQKAKTPFNSKYLSDAITDLLEGTLATNPPLKVKMFRLAGDLLLEAGKLKEALALFEIVMTIDPKKGGRITKVKELKEELNHE